MELLAFVIAPGIVLLTAIGGALFMHHRYNQPVEKSAPGKQHFHA